MIIVLLVFGLDVRLYRNEYAEETELSTLSELHTKYKWDDEGDDLFRQEIDRELIKSVENISFTDINIVTQKYEDILHGFAKKIA